MNIYELNNSKEKTDKLADELYELFARIQGETKVNELHKDAFKQIIYKYFPVNENS